MDLFVHGWAVANTPSSSFENDTLSVVAFFNSKNFCCVFSYGTVDR